MTNEEIKEIIEKHQHWLNEDFDDPDGAHYTVGMIKENG